uniref:Photosystem I subunit XII n=1 Tax=Mallomonas splendens TaxID=52552 RepID=A0A3G2R064_9STRA|nr:photosystem I subunit XII [Mallomonas splendens]YP_009545471.1 photosystem I subunit XII [Mallomonas splendens]AYO28589.1 photosystem I subunit XII [Mallomonas splendens]AYO28625.1 photosystem I subunit XII [Mallomonas splendens]
MITEFNLYLSLFLAFILLTFSIRLGISLYQSN